MGNVTSMAVCRGCRRHVRLTDVDCPFCGAAERVETPRAVRTISSLGLSRSVCAAAMAAGVQLIGCDAFKDRAVYGCPPPQCGGLSKTGGASAATGSGGAGGAAGAASGGTTTK